MNKLIEELAREAGFIFWSESDTWGPGPGNIDWASDYSQEFDKFVKLIVERCAAVAEESPAFSPTDNLIIAENIRSLTDVE